MISREELYRLVWSQPMTKVAEQFNVSGSYMARVCAILHVPRPERGYWAKLAVGKAPPPDPLPEARPGDQLYWSQDGRVQVPSKPQRPPKRRAEAEVRVSRTRTHDLLREARALFENSRSTKDDAYLRPYKKLLVDVTASKSGLDKALEFANDLFNALESVGHRVVLAPADEHLGRADIDVHEVRDKKRNRYDHNGGLWSPWRPTVVYIGSVPIGLAIVEMSEKVLLRYVRGTYIREADYKPPKLPRHAVDHTWTTTEDLPCGRLRLTAYCPDWRVTWSTEWQETTTASLRPQLRSIVRSIEDAAVTLVDQFAQADRRAEIARQERLAAEEKRRREEDRHRAEQSVRESREQLLQVIQQWSHAMTVERFFDEVERRIDDLPPGDRAAIGERLRLARQFVGTRSPLDVLLAWKTPQERYQPLYPDDQAGQDPADPLASG